MAEYVPLSIAHVPKLIRIGRIPIDVALIQVSPPDEFGYVSLGVSVDIVAAAVEQAKLVLAAQGEFLQGAARSAGGKPIICLTSSTDDEKTSRIRPLLLAGEGVSVARTDVH
jgi:acyl-CoA hydrolase